MSTRVEVSAGDGLKIQGNDGYVTIQTNVSSDQGAALNRTRKQVA